MRPPRCRAARTRFDESALETLGAYLLTGLLLLAGLLLSSCQTYNGVSAPTGAGTFPEWAGSLYVGEPEKAAVVRAQANQVVACSSPEFSDFICMPSADFESLMLQIQYLRKNQIKDLP